LMYRVVHFTDSWTATYVWMQDIWIKKKPAATR